MKEAKEYGDCIYCGGEVVEKFVQKVCSRGGRLIGIIEEVPAGVCTQCGERFYKSTVLERVEVILSDIDQKAQRVSLPLTKYAA
jgi:YgiT-type zinc finger domain-containing protein